MEKAILGRSTISSSLCSWNHRATIGSGHTTKPSRFGRVFGGQLLAQAMHAATATVNDHPPHSLHAYFVQSGDSDIPLDIVVERVRDGRSMATRQVNVLQEGRTLLTAIASFHTNPAEPELPHARAEHATARRITSVAALGTRHSGRGCAPNAQTWIDVPPPLEMRIAEPPTFLGGEQAAGPRSHWMRLPRDIGDRPAFTPRCSPTRATTCCSTWRLAAHPEPVDYGSVAALSLDHAIWLHRPVRFDQWHLHTQEMVAITGHRGMVRGIIRDAAGHLVASTAQEVLVRPIADTKRTK